MIGRSPVEVAKLLEKSFTAKIEVGFLHSYRDCAGSQRDHAGKQCDRARSTAIRASPRQAETSARLKRD